MGKDIVDMPEATEKELKCLGIDPRSLFATTPRTPNEPFIIRVGTSRLERLPGGEVQLDVGYYSSSQIYSRYRWSSEVTNDVIGNSYLLKLINGVKVG